VNDGLEILGPGAAVLTVSGSNAVRVFEINAGVTARILGLTVADGRGGDGGGILNNGTLEVSNVTLSSNATDSPDDGGGIFNDGTLILTNSTLSDNSAGGGRGGGILNSGVAVMIKSTFANNTAFQGGGLANQGAVFTVINCTISNNSATDGGGIFNVSLSNVEISHSTLSGNSGPLGGGIISPASFSVAFVKNSIVASATGDNCISVISLGNNYSTDASCPGFTVVTPGQLALGPLASNGGPTQTHGLLPGSVAIDAATDCTDIDGNPVNEDQRGALRPFDGDGAGGAACDAGSYELGIANAFEVPALGNVGLVLLSVALALLGVAWLRR
jgi:hypothetical protein